MSEFNKYSTDGGATFLDVEDSNAVHWGEQSKDFVGKNRFQLTLSASYTDHNVTITPNANKSITLNNTANGTFYPLVGELKNIEANKEYVFSQGTLKNKCRFVLNGYNGNTFAKSLYTMPADKTSMTFTPDFNGYDNIKMLISIENGASFSNDVFYPMVYLSSISDSAFEERLLSNKELFDIFKKIQYKSFDVLDKTGDFSEEVTNIPNGDYIVILRIRAKSSGGNINTEINSQECMIVNSAVAWNHYASMTKITVSQNKITFHSKTYNTATLQDAYITIIPLQ